MFFWNYLAFSMTQQMLAIWSLIPLFSKSSLNIWKFLVHVLLKPCLENLEHYVASAWDMCNCAVVWTFFGTAFLWDWNENWRRLQNSAVTTGLEKVSFHSNPEKGNAKKFTKRLSINHLALARLRCVNRSSTSTPCYCMILNVQLSVTMI